MKDDLYDITMIDKYGYDIERYKRIKEALKNTKTKWITDF